MTVETQDHTETGDRKRNLLTCSVECVGEMISISRLLPVNIRGCIKTTPRGSLGCMNTRIKVCVGITSISLRSIRSSASCKVVVAFPHFKMFHYFRQNVRKLGTGALQGNAAAPQEACSPCSYKNLVLEGMSARQQQHLQH